MRAGQLTTPENPGPVRKHIPAPKPTGLRNGGLLGPNRFQLVTWQVSVLVGFIGFGNRVRTLHFGGEGAKTSHGSLTRTG